MFDSVKQGVSLLDVISKDLGVELKPVGSANYGIEDERDHGGCPFCTHNDCFRVKYVESEQQNSIYHCFSCEAHGDVIGWRVARAKEAGKEITPKEAALELAREYNIQLPNDYNPLQEIFRLAGHYYETCLWETCNRPYVELGRMTPLQYQKDVRRHSEEALKTWHVGWSDGRLVDYLEGLGFDQELLIQSGLCSVDKKTGRVRGDFLPAKCFIYPHYVKGRVSHFTFKDPLKKLAYQLPKKFSLNGYMFYGQDTVQQAETVVVVEGENDLLSCWDTKKVPAVIATIGQISGEQLDWIKENLAEKNLITLFDPDDAGDKYRIKVEKLRRFVKKLAHVRPPDGHDIDKHLAEGADLESLILNNVVKVEIPDDPKKPATVSAPWDKTEPELSPEAQSFQDKLAEAGLASPGASEAAAPAADEHVVETEGNSIIQRRGAYYRTEFKDGDSKFVKISDFIIQLRNVFLMEDGERRREIIIVREDGYVSEPVMVDSETKVSMKPFRTLLARAADASFTGRESDMSGMWDLVYSQASEILVRVPRQVGRHEGVRGWIFRNKFISDTGTVTDPDKDGIFWLHGKSMGIRAESLNVSNLPADEKVDIPFIDTSLTVEEKDALLKSVIENLAQNRNNPGQAITLLGWMYSCIHSNTIFDLNRGFPFLFLWGVNGKGKTTIARWLQDFVDMRTPGYTSVPQLKSGVGLGRKAQYYSSLPILIDEVRSNRETEEYLGVFRSYYDRTSRDLGTRDGFGVRVQEVRSTFIFVGEDQFDDQAARERCIPLRISPTTGSQDTFKWLEDHKHLFTGIAYHWILEATSWDKVDLNNEIRALDKELVAQGCPQRTSKNWAAIGVFGLRLAKKYMPDFDYKEFLVTTAKKEASYQKLDTTLMQFFEYVEAIQAQENPKITANHVMEEDGKLHIWFPAVYKIVQDEARGKFPFSKNAVLSALREEGYFLSDERKVQMGMSGVRRVVVTLDLSKSPDSVKNIALTNA